MSSIKKRNLTDERYFWLGESVITSKTLNSSDKLVYVALAYYSNHETQKCYPSISTISELISLHRETVIKSIKKLAVSKFISASKNVGIVTTYTLIKSTSRKGELALVGMKNLRGRKEERVPVGIKNRNYKNLTRFINNNIKVNEENIYKRIENNELVIKITEWAYSRASVKPACSKESFMLSVMKGIDRAGEDAVHKLFADEDNAITFLINLKTL